MGIALRSRNQAPVLHVALELAGDSPCLPPAAALPSRSSRHSPTTSLLRMGSELIRHIRILIRPLNDAVLLYPGCCCGFVLTCKDLRLAITFTTPCRSSVPLYARLAS